MYREQFYELVADAVKTGIPEVLRNDIDVRLQKVIKTNDEVFHGISIIVPDRKYAPTIYIEQCYDDYKKGMPIEEIANGIIQKTIEVYNDNPVPDGLSLQYEDIEDKLVVQLADAEKNKERLKELVYKPVGNGYVLIPYIVVKEDENASMRAAVTKPMAQELGYDIDKLMNTAFQNTVERYEPIFVGMEDVLFTMGNSIKAANPMKEDFTLNSHLGMYLLSNTRRENGAAVLYYPDMARRIGEILGDSYYVLPSSRHEVLIIPDGAGLTLQQTQMMVRDVNQTVVEPQDILSDRVLFYDREKNRLIEPKEKERTSEERGA